MFKGKNIRSRIFTSYAMVFLILFLIALTGINFYVRRIQEKNSKDNLSSLAYTVSEQLDSRNEYIYNFTVNVSSSNTLLTSFFSPDSDDISLRRNQDAITNQILSISGPMYPLHRIVLRRQDGMLYEYSSREINLMMENERKFVPENYKEALEQEGVPCFSSTFEDENAEFLENVPVISVCLSFPEMYGNNYSNTIEVQETYDTYKQIIENSIRADSKGRDYKVFVYDSHGDLIYPYTKDLNVIQNAQIFWEQISKENTFYEGIKKEKNIGNFFISPLSEWTTLILCDYSMIKGSYYEFLLLSTLIGIVFLFTILYISYNISASITVPLQKIIKSISEYNLDSKEGIYPKEEKNLDEIAALGNTFDDMSARIKTYVAEVTALKVQDLESRYYALQSQMNPHFLYNSLSILSIMCEEGRKEESVEFCEELAAMLRYSSSNSFQSVSLEEEMEYTKTYLKLLQKRYDPLLDAEVVIPDSLKNKRLPRLIIQPLAENAVKYGMDTTPPWFISVEASETEKGWQILVSDTGTGFSQKELANIRKEIKEIETEKNIPELKIGKMGLLNIYIRLKLFFQDKFQFKIGNMKEGGAFVQVDILEDKDNEKITD